MTHPATGSPPAAPASRVLRLAALVLLLLALCAGRAGADELRRNLEDVVNDFDRQLAQVGAEAKYTVVVHSFIDVESKKGNRLTREVEGTLIDLLIDRLRGRRNIMVLERDRLGDLDKELTFDTKGELTWDKKMFQKLGAGSLITGSVDKRSKYVLIRAKMVDILTGEIQSSSSTRVYLDELDAALLKDYEEKKEPPKKEAPKKEPEPQQQQQPQQQSQPQQQYPPPQQYPGGYNQPYQNMGYYCCDAWGNPRCVLVEPLPIGSPCFCYGQGSGYVCQ